MTRIAAAAVLLLALAGCSDDPPAEPDATASEGPARTATCTLDDAEGTTVRLTEDGDELTATFTGTEVPDTGTAVYVVDVRPDARDEGAQLGMKFQDGGLVAYYLFDTATYQQFTMDGQPDVSGDTVEGTFALDASSGATYVTWSAAVTIDGGRDAVCPVDDKPQPFPG